MLTRTLPQEETKPIKNIKSSDFIAKQVDERGFYLYEWISSDELRITLERDYLTIVRWASIPLAVITAIAGFIGFAGWPIGTILAALMVLGIFYFFVAIVLSVKFMYYSYLYTRGANVVMTDHHYVSWGHIIENTDIDNIKSILSRYEKAFDEPFMWESRLEEKKRIAKTELFDNLKEIAWWWWKLLQKAWRSRDSWGLVIALLIAGFLYTAMMWIVYFVGIFFISLFGRIFAWLAHRYLLATSNVEHKIQTLFTNIHESSINLHETKNSSISLLTEAWANEWAKSLSSRLEESFELMDNHVRLASNDAVELRKLLESSRYKDIFNFVKYWNWIRKQILAPIEEIYLLLQEHHNRLESTISSLDRQIATTPEPSLQKPLLLQHERIVVQLESIDRIMQMLEGYKKQLTMKK